jgi:hypothetical protein
VRIFRNENDLSRYNKSRRQELVDFTTDWLNRFGWFPQDFRRDAESYYRHVVSNRWSSVSFPDTSDIFLTAHVIALLYELADQELISCEFRINFTVHSIEFSYQEYLASDQWKDKRAAARRRAGYACQICNSRMPPLDAHHRTYERIGNERDGDLIVLCRPCHRIFHDNGRLAASNM